jgi:hypothetical protein
MIDKEMQIGLAWRMMIAYLLFLFLGVFLMFAPSFFRLAGGGPADEGISAAREFLILHNRIWPAVLVTLAGVFLYTLFVSHRIAGPIYRINVTLKKMLASEYPDRVTLRDGDFFHETAALLQELSRKLEAERKQNN